MSIVDEIRSNITEWSDDLAIKWLLKDRISKDYGVPVEDVFFRHYESSECNLCKHILDSDKRTCKAYPDGIPEGLWRTSHRETTGEEAEPVTFQPDTGWEHYASVDYMARATQEAVDEYNLLMKEHYDG